MKMRCKHKSNFPAIFRCSLLALATTATTSPLMAAALEEVIVMAQKREENLQDALCEAMDKHDGEMGLIMNGLDGDFQAGRS